MSSIIHPIEQRKDFLLAAIRCARLRVQLLATELDEIGIALRYDMISPEGAVSWLFYSGADTFLNVEPFTNKIGLVEDAA